jgi:hypothetical protein
MEIKIIAHHSIRKRISQTIYSIRIEINKQTKKCDITTQINRKLPTPFVKFSQPILSYIVPVKCKKMIKTLSVYDS